MNGPALLGILIGLLGPPPSAPDMLSLRYFTVQSSSSTSATPQTTNPSPQPSNPPATASTGEKQKSSGAAKPAAKTRRTKKNTSSACASSPAPLTPISSDAAAAGANSPAQNPCPPAKKIVRNGGSDEPNVQLTGGTSGEQALHQRSTEQLTAATEDNLKKIAGRSLTAGQQETVSQIKQFMEQSKAAAAAGDLDLAHSLALKAQLLSNDLVNPQ